MKACLLLILISSSIAFGQKRIEADTFSNIISYKNAWQFKGLIRGKFSNLTIDNSNNDPIVWQSNNRAALGLGVYHKWIGLTAFFDVGLISQDESTFGETESFNFLFNMYPKNFALELYAIVDRGFYLENADSWISKAAPFEPTLVNSNLTVATVGLNMDYYFNGENYSIRAPFVMFERLKRSAGSFLLGGYFNLNAFDTDSISLIPFIPDPNDEALNKSNIKSAFYSNLGVLGGYSHMFIVDEYYFFSATAALGLNIQNSNISTFDSRYTTDSNQLINSKFRFGAAIGYNSEKYFFSLGLTADNADLDRDMSYGFGFITLQGGFRYWSKKKA